MDFYFHQIVRLGPTWSPAQWLSATNSGGDLWINAAVFVGKILALLFPALHSKMTRWDPHLNSVLQYCALTGKEHLAHSSATHIGNKCGPRGVCHCFPRVLQCGKSAKCVSGSSKGPLLRPPTHPPSNTHMCKRSVFLGFATSSLCFYYYYQRIPYRHNV